MSQKITVKIIAPERVKLQGIVSLPKSEAERLIRLGVAEIIDPSQITESETGNNVDYAAALQHAEDVMKNQTATIDSLRKELGGKEEIIKSQEIQIADLKKQLMLAEDKYKDIADKKSVSEKKSSKESKKDQ